MATGAINKTLKIVILGATGQIGSKLAIAIKNEFPEEEVLACSRKQADGTFYFDPFSQDWKVLGKVDILINAIGAIEPTKGYSLEKIHIGLAEKIIDHFESMGKPRIIQISALGANPLHETSFLKTKGIADNLLLTLPNPIIVRPSIVITPGTMILQKINSLIKLSRYFANTILMPEAMANTLIQPIMIEDLVDVVVNLIKHNGYKGIVELAGPQKYSLKQLIEMVAKMRNQRVKFRLIGNKAGDFLMQRAVTVLFPKLLSQEQYLLLKQDNVSDKNEAGDILGRGLKSMSIYC
jgi:nucleoside-diphosphate-sugar epimerase